MCCLAGILLGVFFLIFGLKLDIPGETAATIVSQTVYICVGSVLALVATSIAAVTLVKLANEEEASKK